jgi:hypothetical protein
MLAWPAGFWSGSGSSLLLTVLRKHRGVFQLRAVCTCCHQSARSTSRGHARPGMQEAAGEMELAPSCQPKGAGQPEDLAAAKLPTIPSATSLHDAELGGTVGSAQGEQPKQAPNGWLAHGGAKLSASGRGSLSTPEPAGQPLPGSQLANGLANKQDALGGSTKDLGASSEEAEAAAMKAKGDSGLAATANGYDHVAVAGLDEPAAQPAPSAARSRRRMLRRWAGSLDTHVPNNCADCVDWPPALMQHCEQSASRNGRECDQRTWRPRKPELHLATHLPHRQSGYFLASSFRQS